MTRLTLLLALVPILCHAADSSFASGPLNEGTATQVRQIHAYIISRTREALGKRPDSQQQTPTSP
jgi:hypothetical protein